MAATTTDPNMNPAVLPPNQNVPTNLDQNQIMEMIKHLPLLNKNGNIQEVATTLQTMAQQPGFGQLSQFAFGAGMGAEAGPSSHPHGPPDLGGRQGGEDGSGDEDGDGGDPGSQHDGGSPSAGGKSGRGRGGRSANMSNDEWARQRKDNHKEVERRRRGNINDGINELGRIVPNGTGEKAKGAILSRAVQYIHHLKENEARNIEKWTLEKLLMDQAMGDLQAQLEEVRRLWEEERHARQRLESELEVLRGMPGKEEAGKRRREEEDGMDGDKRQRVD